MFESFRRYITEKANLTLDELEMILAASIQKKLKKKQYLLQEGEVSRYNTFIVKGCLRQYRTGNDGAEHIIRFAVEDWWISDRESLTTGLPSKSYIDCLEDSELLLWTKDTFNELKIKIPELRAFEERTLARSFNATQNRIHIAISYTPEEKYQNFIQSFPNIFNRVPLYMIASYLGISRETLNRIRKQFAHK
jgi:CRP-like cAMP-binding protein